VAGDSDFVRIDRRAIGLELECRQEQTGKVIFFDVTISDTTGEDRAVTLVYAIPIPAEKCTIHVEAWLSRQIRNT